MIPALTATEEAAEMNPTEQIREVLRELADVALKLPPLTCDEADRTTRILERCSEELREVADELRARS